ncbi:hypothetical protein T492DRAFT_838993 [Pavlovales sp. CCMP2436]|nr:hypothetical protein T492DRAFT_838993 [Pavlovales sp. CCMP2436]
MSGYVAKLGQERGEWGEWGHGAVIRRGGGWSSRAFATYPDILSGYVAGRVLLCKNRRSQLRAEAAGLRACIVEVPARPLPNRWISHWDQTVLQYDTPKLMKFLEELQMKYTHQKSVMLDQLLSTVNSLNTVRSPPAMSIETGGFLLLYNLFQCSVSLATMLLPLFPDAHEPGLLQSILHTLARKPLIGPFLPEFVDSRKHNRREIFVGLAPGDDGTEAPLGTLVKASQ